MQRSPVPWGVAGRATLFNLGVPGVWETGVTFGNRWWGQEERQRGRVVEAIAC